MQNPRGMDNGRKLQNPRIHIKPESCKNPRLVDHAKLKYKLSQKYSSFSKWFVDINNTKYHRMHSSNNRHLNPSTPSDRSRKIMKRQKKNHINPSPESKVMLRPRFLGRRRPSFLGRRKPTASVLRPTWNDEAYFEATKVPRPT